MGTAAVWAMLCLSEVKQPTVELMEGSSATSLLHCLKAGSFLGNLPTRSLKLQLPDISYNTHTLQHL